MGTYTLTHTHTQTHSKTAVCTAFLTSTVPPLSQAGLLWSQWSILHMFYGESRQAASNIPISNSHSLPAPLLSSHSIGDTNQGSEELQLKLPYGPWWKVVHYVGNMVPFRTHPTVCLLTAKHPLPPAFSRPVLASLYLSSQTARGEEGAVELLLNLSLSSYFMVGFTFQSDSQWAMHHWSHLAMKYIYIFWWTCHSVQKATWLWTPG